MCAFVLIGLLLTASLCYCIIEQRYGLSLAPQISHEQYADNECRVRLVVRPELLLPYLEHYLPEEGKAPMIGPSTSELFRRLLPREIALLARSDLPSDKIYLTLFANEKYGGPYIQTQINNANVLASVPGVQWTSKGLELRERGTLVAEGTLALPASSEEREMEYWPVYERKMVMRDSLWVTENRLLEYWPNRVEAPPSVIISGEHFAELVVDNTNGDVLTLLAVSAAFLGEDWSKAVCFLFPAIGFIGRFGTPPTCEEALKGALLVFIPNITTFHMHAEYYDYNSVVLSLAIEVPIKDGPQLASFFSWATFPRLGSWLQENYNLVLEGAIHWDETEEVIVGTYTLSGIEPLLKDILSATTTLFEDRGPLFDMLYSVNTVVKQ